MVRVKVSQPTEGDIVKLEYEDFGKKPNKDKGPLDSWHELSPDAPLDCTRRSKVWETIVFRDLKDEHRRSVCFRANPMEGPIEIRFEGWDQQIYKDQMETKMVKVNSTAFP